jgi:predicted O-linked N-acetylglucosamine transferase (SPINDLY family)
VESYRQSLARQPDYAPALYNLGLVLEELGQVEDAENAFRRVAEIDPADAEALVHLGALLRVRGDNAEARTVLEGAVHLEPRSPHAHYHLGLALRAAGDLPAARAVLQAAIELDAMAAPAHSALGLVLLEEGRGAEAARELEEALCLAGPQPELLNNLGAALKLAGRDDEAVRAFEAALSLDPGLAQAHLNLGDHFLERGDWPAAVRCFSEGERLDPPMPAFADRLLFAMQQVCDWSRFDELCKRRLAALRRRPRDVTPPFSLLCIPSSAGDQRLCASAMARRLEERAGTRPRAPRAVRARENGRLRVGYLSGDICEHVTAYILAGLFELHDRRRIEVFVYSYGPDDGSAMRARIAAAVEHFVELRGLTDDEAAERIHADGVHILVDLNGYTQRGRSGIAAYRPAPVQVNYLGYPGTLGARYVDYIIVDRFVFAESGERHFTERPVFMPACYAPNDHRRTRGRTPARAELGLPESAPVFCCFNQAFKILPEVFAAWMRILRAVPGSVLWLLEANAAASRNLRLQAARHGVDPARIVYARRVSPQEYLARIPAADLFLDTFPYNAHTTAADALWAGVPVLTCAGETFASRVAGSMLAAAGLPELITRRLDEYESLALRLVRSAGELAALRARLVAAREIAPLFDTPSYVRHLEAAFLRMDEIRRGGASPRPIAI